MGRSGDGAKWQWGEVAMGRSGDGAKWRWGEVVRGEVEMGRKDQHPTTLVTVRSQCVTYVDARARDVRSLLLVKPK